VGVSARKYGGQVRQKTWRTGESPSRHRVEKKIIEKIEGRERNCHGIIGYGEVCFPIVSLENERKN